MIRAGSSSQALSAAGFEALNARRKAAPTKGPKAKAAKAKAR